MARSTTVPVLHPESFFIGGSWVGPSTGGPVALVDARTEEIAFSVAEAQAADMARAVEAARTAFDDGPWPTLTHAERAEYIRAFGAALMERNDALGELWPRESGTLHSLAQYSG